MPALTGTLAADWAGWDAELTDRARGTLTATWGALDAAIDTTPQNRTGTLTAAWGGLDAHLTGDGDPVVVGVYDAATGTTLQSLMPTAKTTVHDEMSKVGQVVTTMLMTDPAVAHIGDRSIVKVTWRGQCVGGLYNGEVGQLAIAAQTLTLTMPTLEGLLHGSPVYPLGGFPASGVFDPDMAVTRTFGPMNPRGVWWEPAKWHAAVGVSIRDDPTVRRNNPKELIASNPARIAPPPGPTVNQPAGEVAHYRFEFYLPKTTVLEFAFSPDNYMSASLDSVEVIQPDYTEPYGWQKTFTYRATLQKGNHVWYCKVTNAARTTGANPLALAGTIFYVNKQGEYAGIFAKTRPGGAWLCTTEDVGWFSAQALAYLVNESQLAGDKGASMLTMSFTQSHDTNGRGWSGTRGTFQFNTMTDTLDDVITTLSQAGDDTSGMDVQVNARRMTLDAFQRLDVDRSADVTLRIGDDTTDDELGGGLIQADVTKSGTRFNAAAVQLSDGRWHTVIDDDAVAEMGGMVWQSVQLGSTSSPEAAELVVRQMMAASKQPQISSTGLRTSMVRGPQLHKQYFKGSSVMAPNSRATAFVKQRVFAWDLDDTGPQPKAWPSLVEVKDTIPRSGPLTAEERLRNNLRTQAPGSAFGATPAARPIPIPRAKPASADGVVVVEHGSNGDVLRPMARKVQWVGSATPANANAYDEWYTADL